MDREREKIDERRLPPTATEYGRGKERNMRVMMPSYSAKVLGEFAKEEKTKVLNFLGNRYGLDNDCRSDIFQEAFIVLWQNNHDGKLKNMTASLSTYFIGICKMKAMEMLRHRGKTISDNDMPISQNSFAKDKCDEILSDFDSNLPLIERKERLVRQIVHDLPQPCDKLLWGFFRDNLAMKALAEMCNYSLGSAKVTKHRCQEKFRKRYNDLVNYLF